MSNNNHLVANHIIAIDEFSFSPKNIFCQEGDVVAFVLRVPTEQQVPLECDGEFDHIVLTCNKREYRHQFTRAGCYEVKNAVFNFMLCTVIVSAACSSINTVYGTTPLQNPLAASLKENDTSSNEATPTLPLVNNNNFENSSISTMSKRNMLLSVLKVPDIRPEIIPKQSPSIDDDPDELIFKNFLERSKTN